MVLKATSVTQLFPKTSGQGQTIHMVEHYEVGKMCRVPNYGLEIVEEIQIVLEPQLIVAILFRDYGTIWICSNVIEIRYERREYRDLLRKKRDSKESKGTTGK